MTVTEGRMLFLCVACLDEGVCLFQFQALFTRDKSVSVWCVQARVCACVCVQVCYSREGPNDS